MQYATARAHTRFHIRIGKHNGSNGDEYIGPNKRADRDSNIATSAYGDPRTHLDPN